MLWVSGGRLVDPDWESLRGFLASSVYAVPAFVVIAACVFTACGLPRGMWRYFSVSDLLVIVKASTLAVTLMLPVLFMIDRLDSMPRSVPILQWLFLVVALSGSRLLYGQMLATGRSDGRERQRKQSREPVLLIGGGHAVLVALETLRGQSWPCDVVGILDPRPECVGRAIGQVPIVGVPDDLQQILGNLVIHGVYPRRLVIAVNGGELPVDVLARLRVNATEANLPLVGISDMHGPIVSADPLPERQIGAASDGLKRALDIVVALALFVGTLPLIMITAAAVFIGLGQPVLFSQIRPGRSMQPFTLYKFRTLLNPGDVGATGDEARTTPLGNLLRRVRFDELPQLWNVLRGDMSLIGPRPLLPRDLPCSSEALAERCSVRPGITGWAQVNGGHLLTPEEKLALDLSYIRHRTLALDLRILWLTLRMMLLGERVNRQVLDAALRSVPAE